MDTKKLALMAVAIVTIGIFALPSTLSLFAGQHVWYDLSGAGNDLPCEKCHADIFEEYTLGANGVHKTLAGGTGGTSTTFGSGYDARLACGACHRLAAVGTFASGDDVGSIPGEEAHAAAVIPCMGCHDVKANWSDTGTYAPKAGGFNVTGLLPTYSDWNYTDGAYTGSAAAHNAFVARAIEDETLQDSNEACLACHTMIGVKINWTHRQSLEFTVGLPDNPADLLVEGGVHNWTMGNWSVNGTANVTVWGNTSGYGNTTYGAWWPGDVEGIYN